MTDQFLTLANTTGNCYYFRARAQETNSVEVQGQVLVYAGHTPTEPALPKISNEELLLLAAFSAPDDAWFRLDVEKPF